MMINFTLQYTNVKLFNSFYKLCLCNCLLYHSQSPKFINIY